MITSTEFCFSRSSSWRSRTSPLSRSTLKTGPDMLYRTLPPSGSEAINTQEKEKFIKLKEEKVKYYRTMTARNVKCHVLK